MFFFLNELYLTLVSVKCSSLNFNLEIWVNSKDYCEAMDRLQGSPPICLITKVAQNHMVREYTQPLHLKSADLWRQRFFTTECTLGIPRICGT